MTIYAEIKNERDYQNAKFGTAFDDNNTPYNWAAYIAQYATRHLIGNPAAVSIEQFRVDMVKAAATAVAAIEAIDRAGHD